jgi:hypothetical protein
LVQQRPAFVAKVSQQLADRLQDCRPFIRREEAELGNKAPTASLPNLPANMKKKTTPARKKTVRGSTPAPMKAQSRMEEERRSRRIVVTRSKTVIAPPSAT